MAAKNASLAVLSSLTLCEDLLRRGDVAKAGRILEQLTIPRLNRPARLRFANLARRVGHIETGLKVLQPFIYPDRGPGPSEEERAEYAILLSLNGNITEAFALLGDPRTPEGKLAKAWCYFEIWDFQQALPLLHDYIDKQKDPYYLAAGWVNVGEAYGALSRWKTSLRFLNRALSFTRNSPFRRLRANAFHVRAQGFTEVGDIARSNRDLDEAESLFGESETNDAFLIHRQRAINEAKAHADADVLEKFRQLAPKLGNWEALREVDFHLLRLQFKTCAFQRLYYGTPHPGYRARLIREFARPTPEPYILGQAGTPCLDLLSGAFDARALLSKQELALLRCLLSDLYVPSSIGKIFADLFPGEHFHRQHSPNRVHQCIFRLRAQLRQGSVPFSVHQEKGLFSLRIVGRACVRIGPLPAKEAPLTRLAGRFREKEFTSAEARLLLNMPKTSVHRVLREGIEAGQITARGASKATRYRFRVV